MNHHLRILKQRIQPIPVIGDHAAIQRKWRRGEVEQGEEEDLNASQDCASAGVQLHVYLVRQPQDKSVEPEQPRPQEKRTLLAAPEC